jgi:formamidopyrimidine-DNA glycosylase
VRRDLAGPDGFAAAMAGRTFLRAQRRGKYLWLVLDDDGPEDTEALLAHLGMSGQLLVGDPDRPLSPHVRARFTFTDGGPDLRFTDQRTFGHLMPCGLAVTSGCAEGGGGRLVPAPIVHIAPDPLEAAFDPKDFAARLGRKKTQVKRALLDQSLISGVGNIYADEALWRAKLHWARPTDTLKRTEVSRLLEAVRDVLTEALKAGGTSFDALYVNVNGESGYFDRALNAYGREGEPCGRCATPIRRDAFMNRSSYSCPRCQKLPVCIAGDQDRHLCIPDDHDRDRYGPVCEAASYAKASHPGARADIAIFAVAVAGRAWCPVAWASTGRGSALGVLTDSRRSGA